MQYGFSVRVRSVKGMENLQVVLFMNMLHGTESNLILTGRNVHNQRIRVLMERCFSASNLVFLHFFYSFEDQEILDITSEKHILGLQCVFIPIINNKLEV